MDGPGGHHPERGNPITKELTQHVLTDKWILAPNLGYPRYKIQFAKHLGGGYILVFGFSFTKTNARLAYVSPSSALENMNMCPRR